MSEGTLAPTVNHPGVATFDVEYTTNIQTGQFRRAVLLSEFPRISTLKTFYASVKVVSLTAEARQVCLVGEQDTEVAASGHIFVAVIPSVKNTDSHTGSSAQIVNNVPNKQTFPLSGNSQNDKTFNFNLEGYESDLAADPRRGAGPVAWIGNSGITFNGGGETIICSVTWRAKVECSGATPN